MRTLQGRIPELDGLRGIAILIVLLYHYVYLTPSADQVSLLARLQRSVGLGWAGVDLFFVLSGFLIGGILLDAQASRRYFKVFYARRVFRIAPLYYLWIVVYFVLTLTSLRVLLKPLTLVHEPWTSLPIYLLFLQNMTRNLHAAFGTAWLGHLWSLAVEEQFYLFMPLAVRFLPRRRLVPLLLAAIILAPITRIIVYLTSTAHAIQYMLAPCRADALSMGVLLAVGWRDDFWKTWVVSRRNVILGMTILLSIVVVYLAYTQPSPLTFRMTVWGLSSVDLFFFFLLVTVLVVPKGIAGGVCRWPVLIELGKISYCVYIIHPVVNLLSHRLLRNDVPQIVTWQGAGITLLALFATYGIAKLSWMFFEEPLLRHGHQYKY